MSNSDVENEHVGELPIEIRPVGGFYFGRASFAAMFVFGSGVFLVNLDQVLTEPFFWLLAALLIGLAFMLSRTFRIGVILDEREMRIVGELRTVRVHRSEVNRACLYEHVQITVRRQVVVELIGGSRIPISFLESATGVSDRVASSLAAINDWAGYVAPDSVDSRG